MNSAAPDTMPPDTTTSGRPTAVAAAPPHPSAEPGDARWATRAERIGLLSISLGAAGLGGAW